MKRAAAAILGVIIGVAGATARADSFDPVVVGARAQGMGGAAIAVAAGIESVAANPAGLLSLEQGEVLLGGRVLDDRATTRPPTGVSTTTEDDQTAVALAGAALPLSVAGRTLALAVAYQRPLELVTHYLGRDIRGGVVAWSQAAAVSLAPWLGAGVAVNRWGGTRDYDHDLADGSHLWWKSEYSGTNATLGLRVDLGRTAARLPVRIGFAARTPFDLGIDYRDRSTAVSAAQTSSSWTYVIEMPWMIGLGIAWEPVRDFTLALDGETRLFGDRRNIATGSAGTDSQPLSASESDLALVRFGAEYRLHAGGLVIPLRAGVRNVPTLSADRRDGESGGQATGMAYSGGLGIAAGRLRADLSCSWSRYARETVVISDTTTTTRTYQTWTLQVAVGLGSLSR